MLLCIRVVFFPHEYIYSSLPLTNPISVIPNLSAVIATSVGADRETRTGISDLAIFNNISEETRPLVINTFFRCYVVKNHKTENLSTALWRPISSLKLKFYITLIIGHYEPLLYHQTT